jgi:cytoskeletal protein RodZ
MQNTETEAEETNLGQFLRKTRINQGFDLQTISDETRISQKNLQSIEDGNFPALPAEAFTRGFYSLYAKILSLDTKEILKRYEQEKENQPDHLKTLAVPPGTMAKQIGTMAERPPGIPFSFLGLIFFFLLACGALVCWYFSWNPATFLSERLRTFQQPKTEQTLKTNNNPTPQTPLFEITQVKKKPETGSGPPGIVSPVTTTTTAQQSKNKEIQQPPPEKSRYFIKATFEEKTKVTLSLDDIPLHVLLFNKGDTATWRAGKKLTITLPAKTLTRLTLNDVPLAIPQSDSPTVTINIPESLLGPNSVKPAKKNKKI